MKAFCSIVLCIGAFVSVLGQGAADSSVVKEDKRFGFGGTPITAFDPDVGLRLGAVINIFDYGSPTVYPDFKQYLKTQVYRSTRGASKFLSVFQTESLLPWAQVIMEGSYTKEIAFTFWGFNGEQSVIGQSVHPELGIHSLSNFFMMQRLHARFRADAKWRIGSSNWGVLTGFGWNRYVLSNYVPNEQSHLSSSTLFEMYKEWNVIPAEEALGGDVLHLKIGGKYDTQNHKLNCTRGTLFDSYFILAKSSSAEGVFTKHIATFRKYISYKKNNYTLTYRISSQQKLGGHIPHYVLPTFYDGSQNTDGLGGSFTMRGIYRNRIVSDGFLLGNIELRKLVWNVQFLKLNWNVIASICTDASFVTQHYAVNLEGVPLDYKSSFFNSNKQRINSAYGVGLYFIYNTNNIMSVNYGFSLNEELGTGGLYVGSSFLF